MMSDEMSEKIRGSSWLAEFFAADASDEGKKKILQDDHFTIDILDNLLCFEETFDSAMTLLLDLMDEEHVLDDLNFDYCHYNCHLQYRVSRIFSPLMGGISYNKRLAYLEQHLFAAENSQQTLRSLTLIKALYRCIKIVTLQEQLEEFDSLIYKEDLKTKWSLPQINNDKDDPAIENYYMAAVRFIVRAANYPQNPDLSSNAQGIISAYIEKGLSDLLMESVSRRIINLFLIGVPIQNSNDSDVEGIDAGKIVKLFHKVMKNDMSMLRDNLSEADISLFKQRITEFYLCVAINQCHFLINDHEVIDNQPKMVYEWFKYFQYSDEDEEISYLYDYFNGKGAWKNDSRSLESLEALLPVQVKQLAERIKCVSDGVNRYYTAINQTGILPVTAAIEMPLTTTQSVADESPRAPTKPTTAIFMARRR